MSEESPRQPRFGANVAFNLAGQVAPLFIAIVAIPALISRLGQERFGLLGLAWVLVGYFSLFDLGLGRALTQVVAARSTPAERTGLGEVVWSALVLMALLGLVGGGALIALAPWGVRHWVPADLALQRDTLWSLIVLGGAIPAVTLTAGLRGLLEADGRFDLVNAVRVPLGILTFAAPWAAVVLAGSELFVAVVALAVSRWAAFAAHVVLAVRVLPYLSGRPTLRLGAVKPLVALGGWMTVSNVISPLMVSLDRFLVASLVSVTAVAYYVTPYEVVTKLWVLPAAVVGVVYPAFAARAVSDPQGLQRLYSRTTAGTFVAMGAGALPLLSIAPAALAWWLGQDFAREGAWVARLLVIGVWINGVAYIPNALLQSAGRPDLCTKLHLIELPLYLGTVWALGRWMGVEGIALSWTLRLTADAVAHLWLVKRLGVSMPEGLGRAVVVALVLGGLSVIPVAPWAQLVVALGVTSAFLMGCWWLIARSDERTLMIAFVRSRLRVRLGTA